MYPDLRVCDMLQKQQKHGLQLQPINSGVKSAIDGTLTFTHLIS